MNYWQALGQQLNDDYNYSVFYFGYDLCIFIIMSLANINRSAIENVRVVSFWIIDIYLARHLEQVIGVLFWLWFKFIGDHI